MTDFEKIKAYYAVFDEQNRLMNPEGRLEFEIAFSVLLEHLKESDSILDLGGGAGRYSIELAKRGFKVTLADLSERLLEQAKSYIEDNNLPPLQGIDVVNALDLSRYADESFDSIILFGPLYHLLENRERVQCLSEVKRVLKSGGLVFASFIPYLTGAVGVFSRCLYFPNQVNADNLTDVFETGKFHNNAAVGFQEGYYPTSAELEQLFADTAFTKVLLRSIRSFGYNREAKLYELSESNPPLFQTIIGLINQTAEDPALLETCGHALYIARKL